jgi:hypothetical protein
MSRFDQILDLVRRAEAGELGCVDEARSLIAQAVIDGEPLPKTKMEQLCVRASTNSRKGDDQATQTRALLTWGVLISATADYVTDGVVAMRDGRVATKDGWDYENCQPEDLYATVSRELSERLEAHVATLTDAEPSNDPERNPSDFDEKFNEVVETALTAFLDRKGA